MVKPHQSESESEVAPLVSYIIKFTCHTKQKRVCGYRTYFAAISGAKSLSLSLWCGLTSRDHSCERNIMTLTTGCDYVVNNMRCYNISGTVPLTTVAWLPSRCKRENMPQGKRCRRQVLPRQKMPKATFSQQYMCVRKRLIDACQNCI